MSTATGTDRRDDPPVGATEAARTPGPVARLLDRLLVGYQTLTAGRISPCRYVPSCSTYAREAVAHHGAARGTLYAAGRLCRCHPWGGHGYDPVPGTDERVTRRQPSRRPGAARRTP